MAFEKHYECAISYVHLKFFQLFFKLSWFTCVTSQGYNLALVFRSKNPGTTMSQQGSNRHTKSDKSNKR